jgi:NAD(P)H-flavin reductase
MNKQAVEKYSNASWPDNNVFELVIVFAREGLGTNYLFKEC